MITSTRNRQVVSTAKLKKRGIREQHGRFLCEGAQAVAEALDAGVVERVFHAPGAGGRVPAVVSRAAESQVPVVAVAPAVMAHLTSTVTPQGIVAVARFVDVPVEGLADDPGMVPVLCSVRDPGNAGTILRSADAAGAGGVAFTTDSVDLYNPKTVRASAGSLFHLPVVRETPVGEAVEHLRSRGAQVLAAAADGHASIHDVDLTGPTVVLLGNEAWGLRREVRDLADRSVRVPIHGRAESLNLAAAATLILFESARQRAAGGRSGGELAAMISDAAHDLRRPLTAVTGFAATLARRWDDLADDRRRDLVRGMMLDAERVSVSVRLLVDAARLAAGRLRLQRERHDLADAARWVAALYEDSDDVPSVEVSGSGEATFDIARIREVLLAVCDAALWWGEGPLHLRVRPLASGASVEVVRGGGGPTPEEAEGAFREREGRVGLLMARRIAEAHGGSFAVEPGEQVRMRLELPA